jgi:hypothetical protein
VDSQNPEVLGAMKLLGQGDLIDGGKAQLVRPVVDVNKTFSSPI